jgi:hypothetical protein
MVTAVLLSTSYGCTLALRTTLPKSYVDISQRVDLDGIGLNEVADAPGS